MNTKVKKLFLLTFAVLGAIGILGFFRLYKPTESIAKSNDKFCGSGENISQNSQESENVYFVGCGGIF